MKKYLFTFHAICFKSEYIFYLIEEAIMNLLSRSEEIILLAIWKLQEDAYGVNIRNLVNDSTGYKWSIGAVYAPLHRLVRKGYVSSSKGDPVPERGGRHKIYYKITSDGKEALTTIKRVNESIWKDAPALELERS
jgi:PadR family transcriptional regulator PadR